MSQEADRHLAYHTELQCRHWVQQSLSLPELGLMLPEQNSQREHPQWVCAS